MRRKEEIEGFPDPIPYTDEDGVERFKEGRVDEEKFLTSRLVDVSKQPHRLPLIPLLPNVFVIWVFKIRMTSFFSMDYFF